MLLEKTQRRLCRLLFVLGCVLPTLAVAGFTTGRLRPSHVAGLLSAAEERLGAEIECDGFGTPRPGVYELRDVTLRDAAGREFLTCHELQLYFGLEGPRFTATGVSVRRPADAWLLRLLESDLAVEGRVASLTIDSAPTIERVSASLGVSENGSRRLRFTGANGARLDAKLANGVCHVEAATADCAVAVDWIPSGALRALDPKNARFRGEATADVPLDGAAPTGVASGQIELRRVSMQGVEAPRGELTLEEFRWRGEEIERLAGRIDLRDGRLSRSVAAGMYQHLLMDFFPVMHQRFTDAAGHAWFDFTQLACDVELDSKGLIVVAGCGEIDGQPRGGAVAHAVAEQNGEPLLREPPHHQPLPTQRLVQALGADNPAELPATRSAVEMASRLPGLGLR